MTRRAAVVLCGPLAEALQAGPVDPAALRLAMCEDVYEVLADLELLDAGVAVRADLGPAAIGALTWPGAPVVVLPASRSSQAGPSLPPTEPGTSGPAGRRGDDVLGALDQLAGSGYEQGIVVAADAPDLPGLLIGKLLRALGSADVAVCPAEHGGLVALATGLPVIDWLAAACPELDDPAAVSALREAAPRRTAVALGPGWHRVRSPEDLTALDRGLEGWSTTRALVDGPSDR